MPVLTGDFLKMHQNAVQQLNTAFIKNPPKQHWKEKFHFFSSHKSVPPELIDEIEQQLHTLETTIQSHRAGIANLFKFINMATTKKDLVNNYYMFNLHQQPESDTQIRILFTQRVADQFGAILADAACITDMHSLINSRRNYVQVLVDCCGEKIGSIEARIIFNGLTESSDMIKSHQSHHPWQQCASVLNNTLTELAETGLNNDLVTRMDNSPIFETTEKILSARYGLERDARTNEFKVYQTASQTLQTARLIRLMSEVKIIASQDANEVTVLFPEKMSEADQLFMENRLNAILEILNAHRTTNVQINIVGTKTLSAHNSLRDFFQ